MTKLQRDKKNPKSKYWRNKCDKEITRISKGKPCIICGSTHNTCYHHLIARRKGITRHDLNNLVALCPSHHAFSNEIAAHSTNALAVRRFTEYLEEHYPHIWEWYTENESKAGSPDYRSAYEELSEMH